MKKIFFTIFTLFLSILFAKNIDISKAQKASENYFSHRNINKFITGNEVVKTSDNVNFYLFHLNDEGFILTSTDTDLPPIIAYSIKNDIEADENNPVIFMATKDIKLRSEYISINPNFANQYNNQWEDLLNNDFTDRDDFQQWPPENSTITDGWILTRWNQSGVYNRFCPLDNTGQRSVVGCVATAMSMILDYHKYIGNPTFDNSDSYYSGWNNPIHIDADAEEHDFPTFEELNVYLQSVVEAYENDEPLSHDDLAALNFAAGISVEMSYSSTGSGSYTQYVVNAFLNKFGYQSASWNDYDNGTLDLMANEMKYMRPVEMSIYHSDWSNGHAIINDGYNTDNFYHLNFGWGTSNATCWYTLPEGMPSNYSIIGGVAYNIEGGDVPVSISGSVSGISDLDGTKVRFDGPSPNEIILANGQNNFELNAIMPGHYIVTATKENSRIYYQQIEVDITEANQFIELTLGDFSTFNGTVLNATTPVNITLFNEQNEFIGETVSNENGHFEFYDLIPGDYKICASQENGYFSEENFTVTLENQSIEISLDQYSQESYLGYHSLPGETLSYPSQITISCGIKLTQEETTKHDNHIIRGVKFLTPESSDNAQISVGVWKNETLLSSKEVSNFNLGEWVYVELDNYVSISADDEFYVGYTISTDSGNFAFKDIGPKVPSKGTFIKTASWTELLGNNDFNFCVEADISANEFSQVSGDIVASDSEISLENTIISIGNYYDITSSDGEFDLLLPAGTYDISIYNPLVGVSHHGELTVGENETVSQLTYTISETATASENVPHLPSGILANYPNPFNPTTTIKFAIPQDSDVTLSVYNAKGQLVNTLIDSYMTKGIHSIKWNGDDNSNNKVSSGIYYFKMQTSSSSSIKKALLLK